ncbi:unnamed protein product [Mytilus coruscus]|uniref:Uncharacterized protein n=1 Tax=Mytilus coruscus TaxID=42192 RepID=A0A6J8BBE5_MYTCO|nr:unnamed protein product [Mytilus coruscus]
MSKSYLVQSSTPLQKQLAASGSYQVSPMLTAVPTNSTIPVESMANSPPTFMTPIMTTSSALGAITGLPQQQADSTDRSRQEQRKPKDIEAALQQDRRSDQIGTEAILRGYKDKDSASNVIERNPETINKATVTFTRIQSKSKRNPNNGVFKHQRVGPVGQRSTPKSIGHETSPHDKTEQMPTSPSDIVIRRTIGKSLALRDTI